MISSESMWAKNLKALLLMFYSKSSYNFISVALWTRDFSESFLPTVGASFTGFLTHDTYTVFLLYLALHFLPLSLAIIPSFQCRLPVTERPTDEMTGTEDLQRTVTRHS